jgi:hypothetical protein
MSRWFLTVSADEPNRVKTHWLEDNDLEDYGIKGQVGEEYHILDDKSDAKSCIVGEIRGKAAELLNSFLGMLDMLEGGDVASQDLRYNIINELVQDVVRAARQAKI